MPTSSGSTPDVCTKGTHPGEHTRIAHLDRASACKAEGDRFESDSTISQGIVNNVRLLGCFWYELRMGGGNSGFEPGSNPGFALEGIHQSEHTR